VKSPCPGSSLIALIVAFVPVSGVRADTIVLSDSQLFGRVVSVGQTTVIFRPGCGQPVTYPKDQVRHIEFNGSCSPRPVKPYSAGGEICTDPLLLYEVKLKGNRIIVASDYEVIGERAHIRSADGLRSYHGALRLVTATTRRLFCRATIPADPPMAEFCGEAVQFAVNFGPESVFGNKILTRGVSFYLVDENGRAVRFDDPTGKLIRDGFGTALNHWMGALQERRAQLPEAAQTALASMISTGSHFQLLTPPQVVQVGCPDTASFLVRFAFHDEKGLIVDGRPKAARAEVEGRTLWINGVRYPCWRSSLRLELYISPEENLAPTGVECVNLVPVLTHELGHAFGLAGHRDLPDKPSIMDSAIQESTVKPTPDDADDLVRVLLMPLQGAAPGRLDADGLGVEIGPRGATVPNR